MLQRIRLTYRILLGYGVPLLLSFLMALVVFHYSSEMSKWGVMKDRAAEILFELSGLNLNLLGIESDVRGVVLLGKDVEQENRFQESVRAIKETEDKLSKLIVEAEQRDRMTKLSEAAGRFVHFMNGLHRAANEVGPEKALDLYKSNGRTMGYDEISAILGPMIAKERELVKERKLEALRATTRMDMALIGGILLIIIVAITEVPDVLRIAQADLDRVYGIPAEDGVGAFVGLDTDHHGRQDRWAPGQDRGVRRAPGEVAGQGGQTAPWT